MTFAHRGARLALVGCLLLAATNAMAQAARPAVAGTLLTGNIYGGYDAPLFVDDDFANIQPTSQAFAGGDVSLAYIRPGRRVNMGMTASASNRYYPDFTPSTAPSYGGSLTFSSVSRGRWQWTVGQFAQYSPLSAATLFAGPGAGSNAVIGATTLISSANLQISAVRQVDVNTSGTVSYSFSRRTHISFMAGGGTQYQIESPLPRATHYDTQVRLSRDITRGLAAYVGYRLTALRVPAQAATPASTFRIDGFDFGVNFTRPFQISRDTTFAVQTGLANAPELGSSGYQFIGSASLNHTVTGSWATQLAVNRDVRFVQAYRNPAVVSGISAAIDGQFTRRIGSTVVANYSSGRIATSPASIAFDTSSASVRLRYDVLRAAGVFVEYNLFRSAFDAGTLLPGFPTGAFGRHGVRAGMTLGASPFNTRP
jgi:hypothetical protein